MKDNSSTKFEKIICDTVKEKSSIKISEKLISILNNNNNNNNNIIKDSLQQIQANNRQENSQSSLFTSSSVNALESLIQRDYLDVNILIGNILEIVLDNENFPLLFNDMSLMISFSTMMIDLLTKISTSLIFRLLDIKFLEYMSYLLNNNNNVLTISHEQKSAVLSLRSQLPLRNLTQVHDNFRKVLEVEILPQCQSESGELQLDGVNYLAGSFGLMNSLDEQLEIISQYGPIIVNELFLHQTADFKDVLFNIGNIFCSLLFSTKFLINSDHDEYRPSLDQIHKSTFVVICNDKLAVMPQEFSFLNGSTFQLTNEKKLLVKNESLYTLCMTFVNHLSALDNFFDLQFVSYLLLKRLYFSFPGKRSQFEEILSSTLVNINLFNDEIERESSEECRIFLQYLMTYGEKGLKEKIKLNLRFSGANVDIPSHADISTAESEYLYFRDFNLRIGYPNAWEISNESYLSRDIEIIYPNSILYVGFAINEGDITFKFSKVVKYENEECELVKILVLEKTEASVNPVKVVCFVKDPGFYKLEFDNSYCAKKKDLRYRLYVLKNISGIYTNADTDDV